MAEPRPTNIAEATASKTFLSGVGRFWEFRTWHSLALFLVAAFCYRLQLGLRGLWDEDARQIYLIGLKYFTTWSWPFYGPDVVYTQSQIPGALQGILAGVPFFVVPVPEAPFIMLNLLSTAGLALVAWYSCRRLPGLPRWFAWTWLFIAPWGLLYGTRMVNPDYVLFGSAIFFIGLFESVPSIRGAGIISHRVAGAMVGFGLLWIVQLHLSWPVLVPLVIYLAIAGVRSDPRAFRQTATGLALGAAPLLLLLLPTFAVYGLTDGLGGTDSNMVYQGSNPLIMFMTLLARFLSLASFELPYFMGGSTADRLDFLQRHGWVIPAAVVLLVVGHLQPLVLLIEGFRAKAQREWPAVRNVTYGTVLVMFLGFLFSVKGPSSHTIYAMFPLAMLYSMYCWYPYLQQRRWRRVAAWLILTGFLMSLPFLTEYHPQNSFASDRAAAARAIEMRDYHIVGERRSTEWGCCY